MRRTAILLALCAGQCLALPSIPTTCLPGVPSKAHAEQAQTYEAWESQASVLRFEGSNCFLRRPDPRGLLRLRGGGKLAPAPTPPGLLSELQLAQATLAVAGAQGFVMLLFPGMMLQTHQANLGLADTSHERNLLTAQYSLVGANFMAFGVFLYLFHMGHPVDEALTGYAIAAALTHVYVSYNGLSASREGLLLMAAMQLLFAGGLAAFPDHAKKIIIGYAVASLIAGAQAFFYPALAARMWTMRKDDESPKMGLKSRWLIRLATVPVVGLSSFLLMSQLMPKITVGQRLGAFWAPFTLFFAGAVVNRDFVVWENPNGVVPVLWTLMGAYFVVSGYCMSSK